MVVRFHWMILIMIALLNFSLFMWAQDDIRVSSAIDQDIINENQPMKGIITITHPEDQKIDAKSFRMEDKPLAAEYVKDTKISSHDPLTITIYRFELPGKPKGLYVLPEVVVTVGGKEYRSFPTTYEVRASQVQEAVAPTPGSSQVSTAEATLRLEAVAEGKNPLYPGERLRFVYRFYFTGNIDLTREVLPLLYAEGFLKIGDKDIKDFAQGAYSVNEIAQTVEAVKPGGFSFGPSIVEGRSYTVQAGRRAYSNAVLKSEAPPVKVVVKPFPDKGKPASFNGAIGKFTFDVALQGSQRVNVGDEMTLLVSIGGKENLHTASLPEMCCQPGFSGFFRLGDLPPAGEVKNDVKTFPVTLRSLTDLIKAIPSVEFSYFDPDTEQYVVLNSKEIPLTVLPSKALPVEDLDKVRAAPTQQKEGPQLPVPTQAIEIHGNFPLEAKDLYNKLFGTWWTFLVVPLGIAFLIFQNNLKHSLLKKKREAKQITSQELFERAFQEKAPTAHFFDLLNRSLKQALVEAGEISQPDIATEDLPQMGYSGEVRAFLSAIDEKRFTGHGNVTPGFLKEPAKTLFEKIKDGTKRA